MSLVFTKTTQIPEGGNFLKGSNFLLLVGTITYSGSYATGGDTFAAGKSPEDLLKQIGAGRVIAVLTDQRGNNPEWNATTKKLALYTGAGIELGAGAYAAAMTASPVPVVILAR